MLGDAQSSRQHQPRDLIDGKGLAMIRGNDGPGGETKRHEPYIPSQAVSSGPRQALDVVVPDIGMPRCFGPFDHASSGTSTNGLRHHADKPLVVVSHSTSSGRPAVGGGAAGDAGPFFRLLPRPDLGELLSSVLVQALGLRGEKRRASAARRRADLNLGLSIA